MSIMTALKEYFVDLASPEWQWDLVGMNLAMIFGFLYLFKYSIAWLTDVSLKDELANKDNPAFGIELAFAFLSFFLVMGAASTGDDYLPLNQEIAVMAVYGVAGMVMLFLSKLVFDKVPMKSFCLREEIRKGNISAALVDGTNMFATAIIVYTYMSWVKGYDFNTVFIVAYGWILSQFSLSALSWVRAKMYKGGKLQQAIQDDNKAVAIRYSAYKVSFAMTSLIAATHYPFDKEEMIWNASAIFLSSILLAIGITVLTFFVKKALFSTFFFFGSKDDVKIDFADEINRQRNIGMATIEAFIVLGITITIFSLLK